MSLVLASRSPRRAELLTAANIPFTVRVADIDESPRTGEMPETYVLRLASEKAAAVTATSDEIVLAADTTVVLDGHILGKPDDREDALRMVQSLAGRSHEVMTGVCLRQGDHRECELSRTTVWFGPVSPEQIQQYVDSGEPMDKAGAYGIQGIASRYIDRIEGSYTNVVGLPVALVFEMLRHFSNAKLSL